MGQIEVGWILQYGLYIGILDPVLCIHSYRHLHASCRIQRGNGSYRQSTGVDGYGHPRIEKYPWGWQDHSGTGRGIIELSSGRYLHSRRTLGSICSHKKANALRIRRGLELDLPPFLCIKPWKRRALICTFKYLVSSKCRQSVVKIQKCLFCPCAKNEKCPKLGHFFGCGGRILILDTGLPADTVRIWAAWHIEEMKKQEAVQSFLICLAS